MFCKTGALRILTKFTGKNLHQSLFFNKVAGLKSAVLSKKRLWHRCFPVNFVKFVRTPFYIEHLWWLFLYLLVCVLQYLTFPQILTMSILKTKCAGERKKQQENAAKLNLPPFNSRLLTLIGAKANEIPCTKVQISLSSRKGLIFRIKKRQKFLLIKDHMPSESGNWDCQLELFLEILNFLSFFFGLVLCLIFVSCIIFDSTILYFFPRKYFVKSANNFLNVKYSSKMSTSK